MGEDPSLLTKRGVAFLRRLLVTLFLSSLFVVGYWMLNQTLDSVVILGRDYVNVPSYPLPVSVWPYHDGAYALLWLSYFGFVLWDINSWKHGHLIGGVVIALFGFSLLTAGLWLAQDTMNAVLTLGRTFVDYPFLLARLDIYASRDASILLVPLGFISYFALRRVAKPGSV